METQEEKVVTTGKETTGTVKTRRVGSATFGLTLIVFGVMFLVHMAAPSLNYEMIFNCWPVIFVLLGVEILVENHRSSASGYKFVYDFPAILMLVLMLFFAMIMAVVEYAIQYQRIWWQTF